jgi:hypothetical protein
MELVPYVCIIRRQMILMIFITLHVVVLEFKCLRGINPRNVEASAYDFILNFYKHFREKKCVLFANLKFC